ncbi:hypothetical protein B0T22DRAFT_60611 [Podospora appendiculata]|uniref:Uncharacterized protein n=1 Tax=Podospora appendiculata TaxID=314037 RepID=A0AAE0XIJ8_9PEZI|nr:hypothetical protein B0T22DRAFT_60611 [Podospora appendiculata]
MQVPASSIIVLYDIHWASRIECLLLRRTRLAAVSLVLAWCTQRAVVSRWEIFRDLAEGRETAARVGAGTRLRADDTIRPVCPINTSLLYCILHPLQTSICLFLCHIDSFPSATCQTDEHKPNFGLVVAPRPWIWEWVLVGQRVIRILCARDTLRRLMGFCCLGRKSSVQAWPETIPGVLMPWIFEHIVIAMHRLDSSRKWGGLDRVNLLSAAALAAVPAEDRLEPSSAQVNPLALPWAEVTLLSPPSFRRRKIRISARCIGSVRAGLGLSRLAWPGLICRYRLDGLRRCRCHLGSKHLITLTPDSRGAIGCGRWCVFTSWSE